MFQNQNIFYTYGYDSRGNEQNRFSTKHNTKTIAKII